MNLKIGVTIFPGSNCDHDLIYAINNMPLDAEMQNFASLQAVPLWHKSKDLNGSDAIIIPGGFSFGDYLRAGALCKYSPIMEEVSAFSKNGGFVLGICNGFQILCEAGLLPGALLANSNMKFSCKNVHLTVQNSNTPVTKNIPEGKVLTVPIAHSEGRYYADAATLEKLHQNKQVLFRYCNKNGEITQEANPNGSLDSIAGICNEAGNVFGMMPHPERASDENLVNTDGRLILMSFIKEVRGK